MADDRNLKKNRYFGRNSTANCRFQWNFVREAVYHRIGNMTDTRVLQNVLFVFLVHLHRYTCFLSFIPENGLR